MRILLMAQLPGRPDLLSEFLWGPDTVSARAGVLAIEFDAGGSGDVEAGGLLDVRVAPADGDHLLSVGYKRNLTR